VTFGEARTILRNDVLAEASTDYYSDADLLGYLQRSAKEIAMNFGFPTALGSVNVNADDFTFNLPSDAANIDLNEVSFDGFALTLAPRRRILGAVQQASLGLPRYYNWEPKRGGQVAFAPKAPRDAVVSFEYVKEYTPGDENAEVWDGLFPAYHEVVVYRAAVKAFEASLEVDRSQYWLTREQNVSQEFSLFLNETPLNKAIAQEVAES